MLRILLQTERFHVVLERGSLDLAVIGEVQIFNFSRVGATGLRVLLCGARAGWGWPEVTVLVLVCLVRSSQSVKPASPRYLHYESMLHVLWPFTVRAMERHYASEII